MSNVEEEQSSEPKFWLEFRCFDDGLSSHTRDLAKPSSATTFPQFAQLPPELRLNIWSYLVQPRIIIACCLQRDEKLPQRRSELDDLSRGSPIPAVLHVNRESRCVGLEHYEMAFSWKITRLLSDTPVSRPARVWFNFDADALFLTGELEAFDSYGVNSPMVYFLQREDTIKVRHIACAFSSLGYPEQESDQIFGCLWHVVDRFPMVERLLLTVTDRDVEEMRGSFLSADNVIQKIWNGWMCGTTVTNSRMADKQMLLVKEEDLVGVIESHQ